MRITRRLKCVHEGLLAEQWRAVTGTESTQRVDDLVEEARDVIMDYQVCTLGCLFLLCLTFMLDIAQTRYLLQGLFAHCESHPITFHLCGLTDGQESADLAILNRMDHTADAGHHCGNRPGCLRGTRKSVLQAIEWWSTDKEGQQVFWLNGPAGTGKSTIAQTFAEMTFTDGTLGASFFCSQDSEDQSDLQAIFPTLAFQLAYRYPPFRKELLQVLRVTPEVRQVSLCSQMEKFIVGPLKTSNISTLIIIDSIDECRGEEPASAILSILSRYVKKIPNVKFFITGQPEPRVYSGEPGSQIHSRFRLESPVPITEVLKFYEIKPEAEDSDIKLFFQTRLTHLAKNRSDCDLTEEWPSQFDIQILCQKAAGFFVCASTIVNFIMSNTHTPAEQLRWITSLPQSTHERGSEIDLLYTHVLKQAVVDMGVDDEELCSHFRTVVGTVLLVFSPLSVRTLSDLLGVSNVTTILHSLNSLLLIPPSEVAPIHIFHKSFPTFLKDPERCTDHRFLIDPSIHHVEILLSCLNLMRARLVGNICKLDDHAVLSEVRDLPARRKECIGDALEYACCFWTNHLAMIPATSKSVKEVEKAIDQFFTMHLLFWIEVLSLVGDLDVAVYSLNDVQQWYKLVSHM